MRWRSNTGTTACGSSPTASSARPRMSRRSTRPRARLAAAAAHRTSSRLSAPRATVARQSEDHRSTAAPRSTSNVTAATSAPPAASDRRPRIAGKLDELDTAARATSRTEGPRDRDEGHQRARDRDAHRAAQAARCDEGRHAASRRELAHRPLGAEAVAQRASLWQSLHASPHWSASGQTLAAPARTTRSTVSLARHPAPGRAGTATRRDGAHRADPDERRAMSASDEYDKFRGPPRQSRPRSAESAAGKD